MLLQLEYQTIPKIYIGKHDVFSIVEPVWYMHMRDAHKKWITPVHTALYKFTLEGPMGVICGSFVAQGLIQAQSKGPELQVGSGLIQVELQVELIEKTFLEESIFECELLLCH